MKIRIITLFILLFASKLFAQHRAVDTVINIDNREYTIRIKAISEDSGLLSIEQNRKNVLSEKIYIAGFNAIQIIDFNKDGNQDLVLTYIANNNSDYLYLFDPQAKSFRKIEGFDNCLGSTQLKSDKAYYYSYERAGCADYNWQSNLFQIVDYKLVNLGYIYGIGCEFEIDENPQVIQVFSNEDKLVDTFPYLENIPKFEDKWVFIEKYWNQNYKRF